MPHPSRDWRTATQVVHVGREPDAATGAIAPPIQLSTTFARDPAGELFGPNIYSRTQNPNRSALEDCLARLEGGRECCAFASGSAAANALLQCLEAGDRVLYSRDLYHGVHSLMQQITRRAGVDCQSVDLLDEPALATALAQRPRLLWCESPANPQMQVIPLASLAARCKAVGTLLVVDNTFATPVLQRPLQLGADLVVHSTTKYLAGHSDVTGGAVITGDPDHAIWQRLRGVQNHAGAVPSPFDCWLTLRGVSTLDVRMQRHCANADVLARRFAANTSIACVLYPGLESHAAHPIAREQMSAGGGMLSVRLAGGEQAARNFVGALSWIARATSLGGVHTLVEHRALVEPPGSRVPRDLVRISVGIEDVEDLWTEFEAALARTQV